MINFRAKLILSLFILIAAVLAALGIWLGQMFKSYYLATINDRLERETSLLASAVEDWGGTEAINPVVLDEWSEQMDTRLSVADNNGDLLYDSGGTDEEENAVHRDIAHRISETLNEKNYQTSLMRKMDVQYHWTPILTKTGEQEGYVIVSMRVDALDEIYGQIWAILLTSLGLSLLLIILIGTKITTRYVKPIESAAMVAIELAKGNYRARTYETPPDEMGMLSTSINILARNLQEMMQAQEVHQNRLTTLIENIESGLLLIDDRGYIVMANRSFKKMYSTGRIIKKRYYEVITQEDVIKIVEDVFMTEKNVRRQIKMTFGLEEKDIEVSGAPIIGTNDEWKGILVVYHDITEIKHLEQMRKDFVANVSHELKTPITSIKGFSETLLDGALNDPDAAKMFLEIIWKESGRMERLVADLLDLSKIEQKGLTLNLTAVPLKKLLSEVIVTLESRLEAKDIALQMNVSDHLVIQGDEYRLKQVFVNLITNAILYTPKGGQIFVDASESDQMVNVKVSDTGIGIEKAELPRIFERFYRVDKARSRDSGGTGLGLAIVKHIMEAHHGKINVESKLNEGTTFTVSFIKNLRNDFTKD
ncbi:ATP-binding protein [Domibacillus sp. DTU_2020_1001157_1_SI_ALB_TIR_016]|uniref:two-component system histidine kinase PnpS n=1 Tax=Domibacillus sp. DTU_2020_1001157_1_SI_ALB_TIR_016 TaxID=3077789 RepID=UPI0028EE74DF|nr:ATP-binding protein [Domibacillus sp. DTU_2020_1001157_1_SI_ALB_TIR_016]WNS81749.1 ATP-binding protein [Domibacillus sp. DTU_2020_1001157_1_SI_ALB_TIR_016]